MRFFSWIFLLCSILNGENSSAYVEYAARYNINSCTACHVNPVGGGPRNLNGKLFGAHQYKMNPFLQQDYISADFRALFYFPERSTATKSGMGIMSGSVAGHVALDEEKKFEFVIESNVAGFQQANLRDTYGLYRFSQEGRPDWFETLIAGRFREAFGIVTEEHRTYTRLASGTEWFNEEQGAMLSGSLLSGQLHYDLAALSGENQGGSSLQQNGAGRWGDVVNLRYMPGPLILGTSYAYHRHDPRAESRTAVTFYGVVSVGRATDAKVPLTVEIEHTRSWNWAGEFSRGYVNDPAYAASLAKTEARAWLVQAFWDFSRRLQAIYKFDMLTPDANFPSDYYQRHGIGLRYWAGPGVIVQVRTELARATHPTEKDSTALGAQNTSFALLQLAF